MLKHPTRNQLWREIWGTTLRTMLSSLCTESDQANSKFPMKEHYSHIIASSHSLVNPFTPKSDQFKISPAASPETWLFIAYSDEKWLHYQILTASLIHFSIKGWENVLFDLGSERVKTGEGVGFRQLKDQWPRCQVCKIYLINGTEQHWALEQSLKK